jgi:DNA-binding SARP family transcriptional activator
LRDGTDITPSAPKVRQAFTLLAMCANTIVVQERFVEELWEYGPPTSVVTTLQTYVYQLRKILGLHRASPGEGREPGLHPALRTSHGGYTLSLPLAALDSHRFETMARRGTQELEAGNVAEAATSLAEALRLWRGPALVDVQLGPILAAERLRLEELRKSALERRIQADLMLGRHGQLVSELTGLLSQAPTNERFAAQLILALHRSSNRAEALRVYERVRVNLINELGLDPSQELQQLQLAVLNSDESLSLPPRPPPARVTVAPAAPCHLPPWAGSLVGRQDELMLALKGMSTVEGCGPPVVAVTGIPGSGKSALVIHASHELREHFPHGQLFAQLVTPEGQQVDVGYILSGFLRSLGAQEEFLPAGTEERSRIFRSHTADKRVLVVLDDMVQPDQLSQLSPVGTGCGLLFSCRRRLSHHTVRNMVDLAPLDEQGGVAMLTSAIGSHRVERDLDAAHLLVAMCDGLPAALRSCTDKLRTRPHWTLRRVIKWIEDGNGKHCQAVADVLNLRPSIERTYWSMSPEAREVFGLFTEPQMNRLSIAGVADVLALDEYEAEMLVEELVESRLIHVHWDHHDQDGQFCYECLPTVKAAGRGLPLSRL